MNEPTFQRCAHDRKNPYAQISREMFHDKSISPKAKGVLGYLLTLPSDWQIYHSQLQDALNVGEDYINSAMDELITQGYADRTREKVKGMFQPYKYTIREFKKCLPNGKNSSGCFTNENQNSKNVYQTGFSGPGNPVLLNKERQNKQQQHANSGNPTLSGGIPTKQIDKAAAVLSKNASNFYYESLNDVDIPLPDKVEISKRYSADVVKNAVAWATHPETKISKGLAPAIKWACLNKQEVPKTRKDQNEENLAYAKKYDGMKNNVAEVTVLTQATEIVFLTSQRAPIVIAYNEKGFKEILDNTLRKCNFMVKKSEKKDSS
jgi:hypothetical protein